MTWSYDPTEPTALDRVRSRIGDTNQKRQMLQNEQITRLLVSTSQGEVTASIAAIDLLLASVVLDTDRSAIGINTTRSQKFQQLKELRAILLAERDNSARPYCGGLSRSSNSGMRSDPDLRPPSFEIGRDDLPGGDSPFWPRDDEH